MFIWMTTVIRQLTDSSSPDTEGLQRVIMLWSGPNESPLTRQLRNSRLGQPRASFGRSGPSSLLLAGLFWHDSPREAQMQQAGLSRVRRTQFRPPHPRTRCDIIGWDIGFLHPPMTRLTVALGRAHWFRTGRLALGRGRLLKGKHHVFVDFISTDDINAGGRFDCRGFVEVFTSRVAR